MKREMPDVRLGMWGCGSLVDYYDELANFMGLRKKVRFVGFVLADQLLDYDNGGQLFLLSVHRSYRRGVRDCAH